MSDQTLKSISVNQQSSNPEQVISQVARSIEMRRSVPLVSEPKATQQQITEAMTKRGFSLNEINGLLSGQQVNTPQMPSFQGASAAQAAPIYQAAVDQGNYNAGMSPWNALIGAGGTALGGYLGGGFS